MVLAALPGKVALHGFSLGVTRTHLMAGPAVFVSAAGTIVSAATAKKSQPTVSRPVRFSSVLHNLVVLVKTQSLGRGVPVHQVCAWYSSGPSLTGTTAKFGWLSEAKRGNTRSGL